ncbi:mycothiol synthase [Herbiconiux sp. KACC 21604]|uniref:mycothiol synthase n=1 Tax=unclassified Herbiconiux TaxID=2618217 RepID=UPI001490B000|nr:mycothiol synthase [Herbiconiux sp. SALV-R1]QJU52501.1 mycothiol synthase [Herbiconiux sp. SALV-R1]WPO87377.1 mycothiol synthase [Herbiconiux sp. KACC 21604]
MSGSLTLSVSSPDEAREPFLRLAARAALVDGQHPFNDQALVDAGKGTRSLLLAERGGTVVGAAIVGQGELEFTIDPEWREEGLGRQLLEIVLANSAGSGGAGVSASSDGEQLLAWAHGDHPASRRLAATHRFVAVRTLLQLRRELPDGPVGGTPLPDGFRLMPFRGGRDVDDWVRLNARVFAEHPEQGGQTAEDLGFRMSEAWFEPDDFLLLRDSAGALVGYNWLKVEPGDRVGEIYVIGVDDAHAGQGLGRYLMGQGLARLVERGLEQASLYVDGENTRAVALYRSLGFTDHTIDIQYRHRGR